MGKKYLPGVSYAKPVPRAWGRGYDGPPLVGTGSIAQQTGTNAALAEFFGMMLDQRFDVMNDRREAAIDRADDLREYNLDLGRYGVQHENYMDELGARQETEGISKSAQGDTNPVGGLFGGIFDTFDHLGDLATGKVSSEPSGDQPPDPNDYFAKAQSIKTGGPRLNARFPLLEGDNPQNQAALADFFSMMLEERFNEQDDLRPARLDRQDDLREFKLDTGRYNAKHDNQMDEIYAREYGVDAVQDEGTGTTEGPVMDAVSSFFGGGAKTQQAFLDNMGADAPKDTEDDQAVGILSQVARQLRSIAPGGETPKEALGANLAEDSAWAFKVAQDGMDSPQGDALFWAIDKLSRPLYAVNEARHQFYMQDESDVNAGGLAAEATKGVLPDWMGSILGNHLTPEGGDLIGSLAGLDGGSAGDIAGGAWKGFKGERPTLSHEIIAENAERDPAKNAYDNKYVQIFAGLGTDIGWDPLNLVGVGLVKAPAKAVLGGAKALRSSEDAAQAARSVRLRQMTDAIAESGAAKDSETGFEFTADELHHLLGGSYKGSTSPAEHRVVMAETAANADMIIGMMRRNEVATPDRAKVFRELRDALSAERDRVLTEFGTEGIRDSLARELKIKISQGKATPEALDELDTTFTSSAIADSGIIEKGNNYENALYSVINGTDEKPGILKDYWGLETIGDVEAKHAELIKHVEDAEARVSGKTKDESSLFDNILSEKEKGSAGVASSERSVTYAKEQLRRFEKDLNESLANVKGELVDINDLMGPKWKSDYRFTDEEGVKMFRQARQITRRSAGSQPLRDRIKAVERQLSGLRKARVTALKDGKSVGGFDAKIAGAESRIRRDRMLLHRMQAGIFVRLIKSRIGEGAGFKEFTNAKEAKRIDDIIKQIRTEKEAGVAPTNNTGIDAGTNVVKVGNKKSLSERLVTPYEDESIDWLKFVDDNDGVIANHPQMMDRAGQLDLMEQQLLSRLSGMRSPNAFPDIEPATRKMLTDIPAVLKDQDAKSVGQILRDHIQVNRKAGTIVPIATGDAETDDWLRSVATILDHQYQDTYYKEHGALTRRLNETTQGEELKHQLNLQDEAVANMFATAPVKGSGKIRPGTQIKGTITPAIEHNGTTLRMGSTELRDAYKDGTFVVGDKSKTTSQINTQIVDDLVDDALNGTTTVNHQKVARLRDLMIQTGKSIPDSPKQARSWIVRNAQSVKLAIEPQEIEFLKQFKSINGLTPREAKIFRDRHLGNIIEFPESPQWLKRNPNGVTVDEYLYMATNNEKTFHDLFAKGPFNLRLHAGKGTKKFESSKDLTARNAKAADYEKWAKEQYEALMKMNAADRHEVLMKSWRATKQHHINSKNLKANNVKKMGDQSPKPEKPKLWPTSAQKKDLQDSAEKAAFDFVENELKNNRLHAMEYDTEFSLYRELGSNSTEDELVRALAFKRGEEYAAKVHEAEKLKTGASKSRIDEIEGGLKIARARFAEEKEAVATVAKEAKESRKMFEHRLKEDAILRVAAVKAIQQNKSISIKFLGQDFLKIPGSTTMFKAMEKAGGLPLVKQSKQLWANAFRSPASTLPEHLQLTRARALSLTPNIIELNIKHLMGTMGHIPSNTRVRVFDAVIEGHGVPVGSEDIAKNISESFQDILPHFQRKTIVGESTLTVNEINAFLPKELMLDNKLAHAGIDTTMDLVRAIRKGKTVDKSNRNRLNDPYQLNWELRVGIEQAIAKKALDHNINNMFGVRDFASGASKTIDSETASTVSKLKGLGWEKIPELGNTHFFSPDVVPDIRRLLDMMKPRNISVAGEKFDKVLGYWKTMATVYNPGYYTRNGIGEFMSSWLAGVNDVRVYGAAARVMKYARNDGKELEALKTQFPLLNHLHSDSPTGKGIATRLRGGEEITHEQAWVLYNDQGLKTGFFSTEFDNQYGSFSRLGDTVRSGPVGKLAQGHMKMRNFGEGYEDYLRMAHFLHALRKAPRGNMASAAKHAAKEVRKYHFDYTDFTNFEKMLMMRTFPFYKWTRKALPLMITMMFVKPGKVMAYPKVMNAISNAKQASTGELAPDTNGFAPNYEEIVPQWIRDLWGYKIAEDMQGNSTYFNLATPQMDIYKGVAHPQNLAQGLLNPFAKVGYEQATSQTMGEMNAPVETPEQRIEELMRIVPVTNMVGKSIANRGDKDGALMEPSGAIDEKLLSFLTGLGVYENNDSTKYGEELRRKGQ